MKRLVISGLALLLTTGGGAALADRGHGKHHHGGHGYKHGHHHKSHWYPRPYYRKVYYYPRHDYHHRDNYYPLGAALIGAAVTYSLYHAHDGGYSASNSEVVGCHRIERYPDGSERRVEVPLGECY